MSFDQLLPTKNDDPYISKAESLVNTILKQTACSIVKKYKVSPVGSGAAMPNCVVEKLTLEFSSYKSPLTKDQLRELLIEFGEELLNNINSNKDLQPYLVSKPFTIKNVSICIYNYNQGRDLFDPDITVASLSKGVIYYKTNDPKDIFKYKNEYEETYEEAKKLLQKENQSH